MSDVDRANEDEMKATLAGLVGKSVGSTEVVWHGGGWSEHHSFVLRFTDGTTAEFSGWGHDAWGANVEVKNNGEH